MEEIEEKKEISFKKLYFSKLRPILEILESDRKDIVKAKILGTLFIICGILVFTLLGYLDMIKSLEAGFFIIFCFGLPAGYFYFKGSREEMSYKSEYKSKIISAMVKNIGEDLVYTQYAFVSREKFLASNIFRYWVDRYNGDDYIFGTVGKTKIEFSEIHAEYKIEKDDGNGRKRDEWHDIFKGLFFVADFNKEFSACTVVLPDYAQKRFGRFGQTLQELGNQMAGSELVKLENKDFENYFAVYSYNQIEARYVLTPLVMEKLVKLREKLNREIYLSFNNSTMYLCVSFQEELYEPSIWNTLLDLAPVERYYEIIKVMVELVDELNLNTRIWSKE